MIRETTPTHLSKINTVTYNDIKGNYDIEKVVEHTINDNNINIENIDYINIIIFKSKNLKLKHIKIFGNRKIIIEFDGISGYKFSLDSGEIMKLCVTVWNSSIVGLNKEELEGLKYKHPFTKEDLEELKNLWLILKEKFQYKL